MSQIPTVWYQQDGSLCYKDGRVIIEPEPPPCVCGGGSPPPPPPPGPCCGPEVAQIGCRPTNPAPDRPITVRLTGSHSISIETTVTGPPVTHPPGYTPAPDNAQSAAATLAWSGSIDQTVVLTDTVPAQGTDCPEYTGFVFGGLIDPTGQVIINGEQDPVAFQEGNPCRFGYYTGVRAVSWAQAQSLSFAQAILRQARLGIGFAYSPRFRAARCALHRIPGADPPPSVAATGGVVSLGAGFDPELQDPGALCDAFATGSTGNYADDAALTYPVRTDKDIEPVYPDFGDRACHTQGSAAWAIDGDTVVVQHFCAFQGPPYQEPEYYTIRHVITMDAAVEFEVLDGVEPCPENIPCPQLPPPPPPPPPPTNCCENEGQACRPIDTNEFPIITLDYFRARMFYGVTQYYSCQLASNPQQQPQAGQVGRQWDQAIIDGPVSLIPVAVVNGCPVYEREWSVEYAMQGLIFPGCSAGGEAIAPFSADSIILRLDARLYYAPGPKVMRLGLTLHQLVSGGGNIVPQDFPLTLFNLQAELVGGLNPPWGGSAFGTHRGVTLDLPGPFAPNQSIPPVPIFPGEIVPGDPQTPGVFGGWKIQEFTSFCHTGLEARGNSLFVPTGDVIRGNGTTRDDVRFIFDIRAIVSGLEECDRGATLSLPNDRPRQAVPTPIAPMAVSCPVCGGPRDYSRCGAPCLNKSCSYSSGCGEM